MIGMKEENTRLRNQLNNYNETIIKIRSECERILKNTIYMNEVAIIKNIQLIKDIAQQYYIEKPKWGLQDKHGLLEHIWVIEQENTQLKEQLQNIKTYCEEEVKKISWLLNYERQMENCDVCIPKQNRKETSLPKLKIYQDILNKLGETNER